MTGSGPAVYLVGPSEYAGVSRLFLIYDDKTYLRLWGTWDGIATLPGALNCWSRYWTLGQARLARTPSGAVFLFDDSLGWRWIVDWATFTTKYHFNPAKIGQASQSTIDDARGPNWT
jgi:hypothetical protein